MNKRRFIAQELPAAISKLYEIYEKAFTAAVTTHLADDGVGHRYQADWSYRPNNCSLSVFLTSLTSTGIRTHTGTLTTRNRVPRLQVDIDRDRKRDEPKRLARESARSELAKLVRDIQFIPEAMKIEEESLSFQFFVSFDLRIVELPEGWNASMREIVQLRQTEQTLSRRLSGAIELITPALLEDRGIEGVTDVFADVIATFQQLRPTRLPRLLEKFKLEFFDYFGICLQDDSHRLVKYSADLQYLK